MKLKLSFLSNDEITAIHAASLRILKQTGMRFPADEALEAFRDAGADILDDGVVRLGETLVSRALETVPKRGDVTLFAVDPKHDVRFDTHEPGLACMTMATSVIDPGTGKKRAATDDDLARLVRLADRMEHIRVSGGPVTPQDVDQHVCDWHTWATCMKNATKHITGGVLGYRGVEDAILMGAQVAGSREAFLERPFISGWVLTLPPLGMDTASLEAMIAMNRNRIPIMLSSGPILGNTGPVTIPGMLAQAHAEILACITLSQLIQPGAPVVYTSFARGMNMKTSNISMAGPEFAVLKIGMAEMGLWLDLPVRMPSMLRDSKVLDAQAGFETGMVGTLTSLKADLMDAMQLDTDMVVDYADLVFCNEAMAFIRHAMRESVVSDESLALAALDEAGPGGNFLASQHTFGHFRTELWHPEFFNHDNWEKWTEKGAKSIRDIAMEKIRALLDEPVAPLLTPDQEAAIDAIVDAAARDLA